MSHAVIVAATLSVATAQTAQFAPQFGTYLQPSGYPTTSQPSFPFVNNNILSTSFLPSADFDIPALFVAPSCIVEEELEVVTLSEENVGRELTYDRELTCDCDTNG